MRTSVAVFGLRRSHSGAAVHVAFGSEGQEAFLEGHVIAFARLRGVPARIRCDNARSLVARVLRGRNRDETERFVALRCHFEFDSFFCIPGECGAREEGGIEGEVGQQHRRFFVPIPKVKRLAELNRRLEVADPADLARHIGSRRSAVGQDGEADRAALRPLAAEPFDFAGVTRVKVDAMARVCVRQRFYSTLVLDHYLEILARRPGALPGALATHQARERGASHVR